ncbi:MAG: hypothetical protein IKY58_03255, partial [Paludibacteraceae bacterium]|nr:hypothetical protein [Paludibacteraceae bacterium]
KIIDKIDKYGATVLEFSYNTSGRLTSISYRGKSITLQYDGQNRLNRIGYNGKYTSISYISSGLQLLHFSGVTFRLLFSNDNFTAIATATENSQTITYSTEIERPINSLNTLKIYNLIGDNVVDESSYEFSDAIIDYPNTVLDYITKHKQVDLTNKTGVTTRVQYQDRKPLYSYEVSSNGEYIKGDVNIYNTVDNLDDSNSYGTIKRDSGYQMYVTNESTKMWEFNACDYYDSRSEGYYLLTGWIKSTDNFVSSPICISRGGGHYDIEFKPDVVPYKQWKFFAYKFYYDANFIKVFPESAGFVDLKDLRINYIPTHVIDANNNERIAISENVLIYHGGTEYDYIPIDNATVTCSAGDINDTDRIYFDDILKFKLNKRKGKHAGEVYYNRAKNILYASSNEINVLYNDNLCDISNFYLGNRRYTERGVFTSIIKDDTNNFLVCEVIDANNMVVSSQVIDNYLDVTQENIDGITTSYTRQHDLVLSKSINDIITTNISYGSNEDGDPTITYIDDRDNATVYTLDPYWGEIVSINLPDGQIITDEYDNDFCAKVKRSFDSNGRSNIFEYFGGNLSRVQNGGISFDFGYTNGDLTSVKKNNALIEEYDVSDTQVNGYYPSKSTPTYLDKASYDKYGRLTNLEGRISNTYKLCSSSGEYINLSNGSSVLAESSDLITNKTTKYAYDNDRVSKAEVFNSSGTKLSEEIFSYDSIGRLKNDTYVYDVSNGKRVSSAITYTKS